MITGSSNRGGETGTEEQGKRNREGGTAGVEKEGKRKMGGFRKMPEQ